MSAMLESESFQSRLALAFTLQVSGIEPHSLPALIEIQSLIANRQNDSNVIMQMVVERARDVAHAAGIGIALLEGERLVYHAGVGTAASSRNQNLTSVLSTCADAHPRTEILRVENVATDSPIEADVCRQFGASALLLLPIYRERRISTGVLAVLFDEPHTFRDREVRTYQLMARLVGESTSHQLEEKVEHKRSLPPTPSTVPQAIFRMTAEMQKVSQSGFVKAPEQRTGMVGPREAPATVRDWSSCWNLLIAGTLMRQAFQRASLSKLHWKLESVPLLIALFAVCGWIAYRHRPLPVNNSAIPMVSPVKVQVPKILPTEKQPNAQRGTKHNSPKAAFTRKRVGEDEIDYVAGDVTIRQFGPSSTPTERRNPNKQVPVTPDISERSDSPDHRPENR